ncbi:N-acyl-D-glucosamine 2-epimerase [Alkalihalobacillus alcalophilus ATCC 27647 = CGMCC 1.3604]|uniref:Cellobiose 2-epimerase n=1 Tax=Alkalihalobacillus alcalophilus ATCC 27647 = CGMCC 1.3604 TaxID=1218173 RepID=A0A094WP86_ALKAL|nr:AGE family epimerase/isomerase [Alkalihalobacillus alcalophilus]KGA97798.1 N-acyl-D-glucosamine 2-epimerase [Alkalihalobacillus alcalophilus ATCC 27647 = CGMCC 1.3604]MED1563783.1 AGE family epimerase/isomerase [Alkalihalobacillus alcalophilus]THG89708.1 N-acyl-D-glucosamine 2-epimerase [Alkalihalobacillus alcalophilus ATCC 27647 = CGMCC 1.3604]
MSTFDLQLLKKEIEDELVNNILPFWMEHTVDKNFGGFYGYMTNDQEVNKEADKGCILNSRILWSYSKAFNQLKDPKYLEIADHAFDYLKNHFLDQEHGGIYWMLDYKGQPSEDRKHIYNQSFGIYGLTEYYMATKNKESLKLAIDLYQLIEKYAYDQENKGYLEAFTRDWKADEDLRLSGKDLNTAKSMNTHLHILEAYTNLYRVWKDEAFKEKLIELIDVTLEHIVSDQYQFKLFFDEEWNSKSDVISYGHDIEGSWLLHEAAEVVGDEQLIHKVEEVAIKMAKKVLEDGIDQDGSVMNELDGDHLDKDKVWWVQAEAVVGFFNAYQLTADQAYLDAVDQLWTFTKTYIIDQKSGEWFWKRDANLEIDSNMPKVDPWKCPYHNSRFCYEMIERINKVTS